MGDVTMDKKFCDKCEKEINTTLSVSIEVYPKYTNIRTRTDRDKHTSMDLCPECYKSFKSWFGDQDG